MEDLQGTPEVRYTVNNSTPVAKFTIAVDREIKMEGKPTADFHSVIVWGKPAENCGKYLSKGRLVAVEGMIENRNWDDQESKRHFVTEIIAEKVKFLDKGNGTQNANGESVEQSDDILLTESDDLPF